MAIVSSNVSEIGVRRGVDPRDGSHAARILPGTNRIKVSLGGLQPPPDLEACSASRVHRRHSVPGYVLPGALEKGRCTVRVSNVASHPRH
jgi:hypothetical protein